MRWLPLLLLLAGCEAQSGPWDCEALGVKVTHKSMGQLASISELPDSEIEQICGKGFSGCTIQYISTARIYYRTGDMRTLKEELCHVMHGQEHV